MESVKEMGDFIKYKEPFLKTVNNRRKIIVSCVKHACFRRPELS